MDGAIHAATARQRGIRGIHNGVRRHARNVSGGQLQRFSGGRGPLHRMQPPRCCYYLPMAYEPGDRPTILSKQFLMTFGIGLWVIAMAVALIFVLQRGSHVELKGAILKVRTMGVDDNSSLAVVDFRFVNSSDIPFVVRSVDVSATGADGANYTSMSVPEVDAKRIFEYYPILGQKFNASLIARDRIPGRKSEDRMIVARFEMPVAKLDARTNLKIRIEDVDGPVSELVEK
jgi:hypothetical protein